MKKYFLAVGAVSILTMFSCTWRNWDTIYPAGQASGGKSTVCDTSAVVSYSLNIVPILQTNCTAVPSCHNQNNLGANSDNYSTYRGFQTDAQSYLVMQRLDLPSSNVHHMPLNGNLNPCDTMIIRKWIKNGCLNN